MDLSFVPPFYRVTANTELDWAYRAASEPSSVFTVIVNRDSTIAGFVAGDLVAPRIVVRGEGSARRVLSVPNGRVESGTKYGRQTW
jgi:hypothetical protein